jgi:AcrR family transcriptional regulator
MSRLRIPPSAKRAPTADAILEAARTLYAKGGFSAVTTRAIAKRVGITSGAIYKHFSSKDEIFVALQQAALQLLIDIEQRRDTLSPLDDLRLYYWRYYEFSKQYPEYFAMLWVDSSTPIVDESCHDAVSQLGIDNHSRERRCLNAGLFPADTNPTDVSLLLWAAAHGFAVLRYVHANVLDADERAAQAIDLTLLAIRSGQLSQLTAVNSDATAATRR